MKRLIINGHQEYLAEKIIKENNSIKLIGVRDEDDNNIGDLLFPNISNINDFQLEDGQEWDLELNEVEELKQALAELTILIATGGMQNV